MFLQVCVILFTGGCLPQCMLGYHTPEQTTPQSRPLQEQTHPLGADTPPEQTHPGADTPPPRKQTPAYGQRAAGTHPTGMHSCNDKIIHTDRMRRRHFSLMFTALGVNRILSVHSDTHLLATSLSISVNDPLGFISKTNLHNSTKN